jgi:hypothetical protein
MQTVEVREFKDGKDTVVGRILWDGRAITAEPPEDDSLASKISVWPIHDGKGMVRPWEEPERFMEGLCVQYSSLYLRCTKPREDGGSTKDMEAEGFETSGPPLANSAKSWHVKNAEFDESKHPRADNGRFGEGSGEGRVGNESRGGGLSASALKAIPGVAGGNPRRQKQVARILNSPHAKEIMAAIPAGSKFVASGKEALVFRSPDGEAVRIGDAIERPDIPEVLQPTSSKKFGDIMVETLPFAEDVDSLSDDAKDALEELKTKIEERGYRNDDLNTAQIGKVDGEWLIIDPGGFSKVDGHDGQGAKTWKWKAFDESSHPRGGDEENAGRFSEGSGNGRVENEQPNRPIESGAALYRSLLESGNSIDEIRQKFATIAAQPKSVLAAIANRVDQSPKGSKAEIAKRLLHVLEGVAVSRVRADEIGPDPMKKESGEIAAQLQQAVDDDRTGKKPMQTGAQVAARPVDYPDPGAAAQSIDSTVADMATDRFNPPLLGDVYAAVKAKHPELSVRDFHTLLAKEWKSGKLRLHVHTRAMTDLEKPEFALPVDGEVMSRVSMESQRKENQ